MDSHSTFKPLIWEPRFDTGVAAIDDQHRILVSLLNEAGDMVAQHPDREHLSRITRSLLEYALYHFEEEERLMHRHGYPGAEAHIAQHREFSHRVTDYREQLRTGALPAPGEIVAFVREWLFGHILHSDKQLGAHILARDADG